MTGNGSLNPGSPSSRGRSHRPRDFEYSSSPRVWDSSDSDDDAYHRPGHFGAHIGPSDDMDSTDTAKEPGTTKRRHHKKTSGGFLLGGSLSRPKRTHASGEGRLKSWQDKLRNGTVADDNVSTTSPRSTRSEKSQGKAPAYVEHMGRSRRVTPPLSGGMMDLPTPSQSSLTPPPRSDRGSTTSQTSIPSTNSASIDPNQLIQMALSLSEGRRRAASGVYTPPTPKQDRRVASHGGVLQTVHPGSPLANDSVRRSMRRSVLPTQTPPCGPEASAAPEDDDASTEPSALLFSETHDVTYEFSISSLQRAERAKKYFELSHNYRKLLQTLPPLPGKHSFTAEASFLGRQYNPLQYLRNERLRQRKNMPLNPSPEDLDDVQTVTEYVNSAQQTSKRSSEGYVGTALPPFQSFKSRKEPAPPTRHSRYNTASSRILYFDSEWSISPAAMLADTIWAEDPQNRWALEDRAGQKLFPIYQPPSAPHGTEEEQRSRTSGGRSRATTLDSQLPQSRKNSETRGRHKRKFLSMHKVDGDHMRRRAWHRGRSQSSSKGSSHSSNSSFGHMVGTTADGINIGPLARHMRNEMQQDDGDNGSDTRSPKWDELPNNEPKASGVPKGLLTPEMRPTTRTRTSDPLPLDLRRSKSFTEGVNDSMDARLTDDEVPHSAVEPGRGSMGEILGASPIGLIGAVNDNDLSLDLEKHDIQMVDFAAAQYPQQMERESFESSDDNQSRKSFESARSTTMQRQKTANSIMGLQKSTTADSTASRGKSKTISQILKGSRLADLVRRGDGDVRKEAALRSTQRRLTNETSDGTDMEESAGLKRSAINPLESTVSLDNPRYHVPLPSFKFPNGIDNIEKKPEMTLAPITRQHSFRRERGLLSRTNSKNKLPRIEIPTDKKLKDMTKDQASPSVRSLLSPIRRFRSTNSARSLKGGSPPNSALASSLSLAGADLEGTLDSSPRPRAKRRWSIADQLDRVASKTMDTVSMRDVERTRALFLSSGIKATQLRCRTETAPDQRMVLLVEAEKITGQDAGLTVRRDEHRVAGKLWYDAVISYHRESEKRVQHFHDRTIPEMRERIEHLRHIVGERLTVRVQSTADEADAFAADLSARQTLAVKAVHDAIDGILRNRGKKFRWLRRMGFSLLEWAVVTIMWIFWLGFTLVRMVRGTLRGCSKAVGWLVWV